MLRDVLESLKLTRRDFLKASAASTALLAALDWRKLIKAFAEEVRRGTIPPIIWFEAQDCAGDTTSIIQATNPDLVEVLSGMTTLVKPGTVKLLYHETIMMEWGDWAIEILNAAAKGRKINLLELARESPFGRYYLELVKAGVIPKDQTEIDFSKGFILVIEGSVNVCSNKPGDPKVTCMDQPEYLYCYIGEDPDTGKTMTCAEWVRRLLRYATAVVAVGNCACYGGIPANYIWRTPLGVSMDWLKRNGVDPAGFNNVTSAIGFFPDPVRGRPGLVDLLDTAEPFRRFVYGKCTCTTIDECLANGCKPAIAVPGCPANGNAILRTLVALVLWLKGLAPLPELDKYWRPKFIFGATVHEQCPRAGSYAAGDLRRSPGEPSYRCLFGVGCKGPAACCPWNKLGWVNGVGGPTRTGAVCIGCTEPGFSDKFEPFYRPLPAPQPPPPDKAAALLGGAAVLGAAVAVGMELLHKRYQRKAQSEQKG